MCSAWGIWGRTSAHIRVRKPAGTDRVRCLTGAPRAGAPFAAGPPTAKLLGHSYKACLSLCWGRTFTASVTLERLCHYALHTLEYLEQSKQEVPAAVLEFIHQPGIISFENTGWS